MKIFAVFAFLVATATAFTTHPTFGVVRSYSVAPLQEQTGAEEYLEQCLNDWDALEAELRTFKAGPDQNNELAAADLAEKMLTKALDTARATRDVELEAASAAHEAFDDAIQQEHQSEAALSQLNDDVLGTVSQVSLVEGLNDKYEDTERLRDLSVAHAAHDEGMDWMARVANAEMVAAKAKAEFTHAEKKLEMLQENEKELKAALKELHAAKNVLLMNQWEKEKSE